MVPSLPKEIEGVVSRETMDKIKIYLGVLQEKSKKFNLIGKNEWTRIWERHVFDCLQLRPFLCEEEHIADMGTGAGFPGFLLALSGLKNITLIESNKKKCAFLEIVSRETNVFPEIVCARAESLRGRRFDVVISRAMAALEDLLPLCVGVCEKVLLLKGRSFREEVVAAQKHFYFDITFYESITDSNSKILIIKNLRRRT